MEADGLASSLAEGFTGAATRLKRLVTLTQPAPEASAAA